MTKKKNVQLYEGMYILSATLSEEARQKALDKIISGITSQGGEVHKIHEQGKKKLAYEIRGKEKVTIISFISALMQHSLQNYGMTII